MKLEITKDKVLEAASKCSQAKETLKTLFPEVFEDGVGFTCDRVIMNAMHYNSEAAIVHQDLDLWVVRVTEYGKIELATIFWDFKIEGGYLIPTRK
jgi:hypothetical protein